MFIVFLWVLVALLTGHIAKKNGRSFIIGAFVGVFTGIVGLIFYATIGPTEEERDRRLDRYFKAKERNKV